MEALTNLFLAQNDIMWCGCDIQGHIGAFYTGGKGRVPSAYIASPNQIEVIISAINALPEVGGIENVLTQRIRQFISYPEGRLLPDLLGYRDVANRGIFIYDFSRESRISTSYFRMFSCDRPTNINVLPVDIQKMLRQVRVSCDFQSAESIPYSTIT